jgi:hypothetical protein
MQIDNSVPHLFGNSNRLGRCDFVLGYSAGGIATHLFLHRNCEWSAAELPEESTGTALTMPSIRIPFDNREELQQFLDALGGIASSPTESPLEKGISASQRHTLGSALRRAKLIDVGSLAKRANEPTA